MRGRLKRSLYIVVGGFSGLSLILFILNGKIDVSIIGMWGLLAGLLLLMPALPIHKVFYFGGRGIMGVQSPEIPQDEHLHHQMHKIHEQEHRDKLIKNRRKHDVLTIAGIFMMIISLFLI